MSFTWHFYTGAQDIEPVVRRCHRGPMIDVEQTLSVPFTYMTTYNTLRVRLLEDVVDSILKPVQTREVVLRAINSLLGPMFYRLAAQKKALQVLICEKKDSISIETDLVDLNSFYLSAAQALSGFRVPSQQIELLVSALESKSPVMRVAGKCATILLAAFIEMDYHNG